MDDIPVGDSDDQGGRVPDRRAVVGQPRRGGLPGPGPARPVPHRLRASGLRLRAASVPWATTRAGRTAGGLHPAVPRGSRRCGWPSRSRRSSSRTTPSCTAYSVAGHLGEAATVEPVSVRTQNPRRCGLRRPVERARHLVRDRGQRAAGDRPGQVRRRTGRHHHQRSLGAGERRPRAAVDHRRQAPRGRRDRDAGAVRRRTANWSSPNPAQVPTTLGEVDVVFPLLHGPWGEDGTLQGLLEMSDIRYVGSGVLASAVGMDKHYMKVVFAAAGLGVTPYVVIRDRDWTRDPQACREAVDKLGYPVFVKPARGGSSLGISKVNSLDELDVAIAEARRARPEGDRRGVGEEPARDRGRRTAAGWTVVAPEASVCGEISVSGGGHDFYDFETKYLPEGEEYTALSVPADAAGADRGGDPREGADRLRRDRGRRAGPGRLLPRRPTSRWSSTRSTPCRASRRPACSRGCGPSPASTTRNSSTACSP